MDVHPVLQALPFARGRYLRSIDKDFYVLSRSFLLLIFRKSMIFSGTPFEIYTDREGKINHAKRILALTGILFALNLVVALYNLGLGLLIREEMFTFNAYLSAANFAVVVLLLTIIASQVSAIRRAKKDKRIRE